MKRNVKIMAKLLAACTAAMSATPAVPAAANESVVLWQCTTEQSPWVDMGPLTATEWDGDTALYIDVDETVRYQTLSPKPWGGCFNERGWTAMKNLTDGAREEIIKSLFGGGGLDLSVGRLPLGNSDFSVRNDQSYDELPAGVDTDYDMKYFTIENDRENLLPYIREALKVRPDISFWASPWSPPAWMKQNKSVPGPGADNTLEFTPEVLRAYAAYFVKYIQAYQAEGINVARVMPQNEPTINVGYPSCYWSGEQLNEFIRDYLSPALREAGLDTEIYLGTFTDSQAALADPTLSDPATSKIIKGIGFQWWSAPLAKRVYRQNQNVGYTLMQSETKCGNGGNTWLYGEEHFDCLKEFFEAGVNEYMLWNMVLDEKGLNTNPNPWPQNAPIIVNSVTNEVTYTPMYHISRHFSAYIHGGARRIKTDGNYGDKIAFQNSDGENVLVVKNSSDMYLDVAINFNGRKVKPTIPPHSVNTFRTAGDNTGFDTDIDATYLTSGGEEEVFTMAKLFNLKCPNMSLSVSQASFDNGAELIAWDDRGAVEQQWIFKPTEDGWYRIESFNSEKVIGIWAASTESGGRAVQWEYNGSHDQQWRPVPVFKDGKTYYKLQNRNSLLFLSYGDGVVTNGTPAVQSEDGGDALLWELNVTQGSGFEEARPLSIADTKIEDGSLFCKIVCGQDGEYTVYCASYDGDGKVLSVTSRDYELVGGQETDFSAHIDQTASRVSVYGWFTKSMTPAIKRTDVK